MPGPVEFVLRLIDRVSGPAGKAAASLRAVDAAARGVDASGLDRLARGAGKASAALGGMARGGLAAVGGGLARVGKVGAIAVAGLGALAGAGLARVTQMGASAQSFREDSIAAMRILLKSNGAAQRAADMAMRTAAEIGRGPGEVLGQFVDLLAKGFSTKRVDEIVRALADLSVVDPKANMESLSRTIGQIAAKGRLQGEEILQLSEAGLEAGAVYDALARKMGVTRDAAQKMITAGKVSSTVAVDAILAAISSQTGGGKLGQVAAQRAVSTTSGQIDAIKGKFEALLLGTDSGGGVVRGMLSMLSGALDSSSARGLADAIASIGEAASGVFRDLSQGDIERTFQRLAVFARHAAMGVEQLAVIGRALGEGLGEGLGYTADALQALDLKGTASRVSALSSVFRVLGMAIGGVIAVATTLPLLLGGAARGISAAIDAVGNVISAVGMMRFSTIASQLGSAIVGGIVGGIKAGAAAVAGAVSGVAQGAIDTAKSVLKIRSPSRVFHDLGSYSMEGYALGVQAGAPGAQAATTDAVAPPAALAVAPRAGGSVTINVSVALARGDQASAEQAGEAIALAVRRELEGIFASMAASEGAAT